MFWDHRKGPQQKHKEAFGRILEEVTADSGYCSEKNLLYLKENGIDSYIKLQDHEKRKSRAYKEDIGKYYNMTCQVFEDEHYYICHDGRELRHMRTETREQDGYTQTFEVYGCADCSGCVHKEKYIKSSCCMRLAGTSINITVSFIMRLKNLKEKRKKRPLRKKHV